MSIPQPVVFGYYRWSDIFYQWAHEYSDEPHIRSALKGILSPAALTHEDHPLRSADEGGIELWIGTFHNGKLRLLFSSAQIEYIRYWIKEMGYTDGKLISIPDSSFLLSPGKQLRAISPVIYSDTKAIKHAQKSMEKTNRRLVSPSAKLLSLRSNFERVRNCWHSKLGTWCAIDFETWEREHSLVTEVGMSLISWEGNEETLTDRHLIVTENKIYTNSTFIQGNRDYFLFGKSEDLPLEEVKRQVCECLTSIQAKGPLFLLFHTRGEDVRVLRSWKAPLADCTTEVPGEVPASGIYLVDTVDLFAALSGNAGVRRNLERMCRLLDVPDLDRFHNAGNDARFTLMAVKTMAGGLPLDVQRDQRWPNQTNAEVEVEWKPWQDDSDFSDTEGVFDAHVAPESTDILLNQELQEPAEDSH